MGIELLIIGHKHQQCSNRDLPPDEKKSPEKIEIHPYNKQVFKAHKCVIDTVINLAFSNQSRNFVPVAPVLLSLFFLQVVGFNLFPILECPVQIALIFSLGLTVFIPDFLCFFPHHIGKKKGERHHTKPKDTELPVYPKHQKSDS